MNHIALIYLMPLDDLTTFTPCALEWADTYRKFPPGVPHDVHIVFCNGTVRRKHRKIFNGIKFTEHLFRGHGWDIGTYQWASQELESYPLAVFMNARTHFWKRDWLNRLIEGMAGLDPRGLFGMSSSYEMSPFTINRGINPHIRTAAFATNPKTFNRYPYLVDSREKGFFFESGMWNFSQWYEDMGYPVVMITWDGVCEKKDWRKPENIFRRGDQSNLLVCDRHTKMFKDADPELRKVLSVAADTGSSKNAKFAHLVTTKV